MSKYIDKDKALEYIAPTIEVREGYVSREVVLNLMRYYGGVYTNDKIMEMIESLPPVESERPKGEWLDMSDGGRIQYIWYEKYMCNKCGERGTSAWLFCPNCGADMRGDKE